MPEKVTLTSRKKYGTIMNNKPESSRRIKDMDTRPNPIHVDDFNTVDPDEKWVPGNKRPPRNLKAETPESKEKKAVTQDTVENGIYMIHKTIILIIAIAAVVGIGYLAIWVAGTYDIDVGQQFRDIKESILP